MAALFTSVSRTWRYGAPPPHGTIAAWPYAATSSNPFITPQTQQYRTGDKEMPELKLDGDDCKHECAMWRTVGSTTEDPVFPVRARCDALSTAPIDYCCFQTSTPVVASPQPTTCPPTVLKSHSIPAHCCSTSPKVNLAPIYTEDQWCVHVCTEPTKIRPHECSIPWVMKAVTRRGKGFPPWGQVSLMRLGLGEIFSTRLRTVQKQIIGQSLTGAAGTVVHKNPRSGWWDYSHLVEEIDAAYGPASGNKMSLGMFSPLDQQILAALASCSTTAGPPVKQPPFRMAREMQLAADQQVLV